MTDKVQKIREEVERLKESGCESPIVICDTLLSFIDSIQEEPVRKTSTDIESAMQEVEEKSKAFTEAHKREGAEEILAGMKGIDPSIQEIVDKHWFEMLGEEPILEVLAKYLDHVSHEEAMKTKDAIDRWFDEYYPEPVSELFSKEQIFEMSKNIQQAVDKEMIRQIINIKHYDEPVSEDYDNALHSEALTFLQEQQIAPNLYADMIIRAVKHGAQWQKQRDKDEMRVIRELLDNFDKTCDEYHDAGFKHGQEALIKDAVEGLVVCDELTHYYKDIVMPIPDYLKVGDKVKLIIIKED